MNRHILSLKENLLTIRFFLLSLEEGMHSNVYISSFINIWQTISTSQSLSATFVFVFYELYLTFWE